MENTENNQPRKLTEKEKSQVIKDANYCELSGRKFTSKEEIFINAYGLQVHKDQLRPKDNKEQSISLEDKAKQWLRNLGYSEQYILLNYNDLVKFTRHCQKEQQPAPKMLVEEYFHERFPDAGNKHSSFAKKFDFYDMTDFAQQYHQKQGEQPQQPTSDSLEEMPTAYFIVPRHEGHEGVLVREIPASDVEIYKRLFDVTPLYKRQPQQPKEGEYWMDKESHDVVRLSTFDEELNLWSGYFDDGSFAYNIESTDLERPATQQEVAQYIREQERHKLQ
jgi:hypothetical protein